MQELNTSLFSELFSAKAFNSLGHELIDLLTKHLQENLEGKSAVLNWQAPSKAYQNWQAALPIHPTLQHSDLISVLDNEILFNSLHIHHPRNMGHQVSPPLPVAALCDLVAALTNQAMAVYETGPSATMLERQVTSWLGELIGWKNSAGLLTSGGAQANLTALLAARQMSSGSNIWKYGLSASEPLCILCSEHSHYSVTRAAGIMGLGTNAVVGVATDYHGSMSVSDLSNKYAECIQKGIKPMALVATAGCTPTGSIDPLFKIAEFCQQNALWLHVDGAHGASALLSEQYQKQLHGIALADSVVWDGHKLLYMPAAVSAVLFRKPEHSYAAFAQEASYLFQGNNDEDEAFNSSYRTLECTKRMMGLKLWLAFSLYGTEQLGKLVEKVFATSQRFAQKINQHPNFELLMLPQTNIVCFRHQPLHIPNEMHMNAHQIALRKKVVESGAFHITQVTLHGCTWLRTTIMNPLTQDSDLADLLALLNALGEQLSPLTT